MDIPSITPTVEHSLSSFVHFSRRRSVMYLLAFLERNSASLLCPRFSTQLVSILLCLDESSGLCSASTILLSLEDTSEHLLIDSVGPDTRFGEALLTLLGLQCKVRSALSVVLYEGGSEERMRRRISQTNSHSGHLSAKRFLSVMGNKRSEAVCSPLLRTGLCMVLRIPKIFVWLCFCSGSILLSWDLSIVCL